jgi:hypothetical protein
LNGTELPFADFLVAVADLRRAAGRDETVFVGVFVDNQSQRVNRVKVQRLTSQAAGAPRR